MKNEYKNLLFSFTDPLNKNDTNKQTYGCRTNPDLCKNCLVENICAFNSENKICKKPSVKWEKQYYILLEKESHKNGN